MSTLRMDQKLQGFTMIELVIVVALIGILAAIGIARFSNMVVQAQIASNKAFGTALSEGIAIAHAAWIAAGAPATESMITMDGTGVYVDFYGFPDDDAVGQWGILTDSNQCIAIASNVIPNPPQMFALTGTSCTQTPCYVTSTSGGTCTFTMYAGPTAVSPARTVTYNVGSGSVTVQ